MELIESKSSMDIPSSTKDCQYVIEDIAWITFNTTD